MRTRIAEAAAVGFERSTALLDRARSGVFTSWNLCDDRLDLEEAADDRVGDVVWRGDVPKGAKDLARRPQTGEKREP